MATLTPSASSSPVPPPVPSLPFVDDRRCLTPAGLEFLQKMWAALQGAGGIIDQVTVNNDSSVSALSSVTSEDLGDLEYRASPPDNLGPVHEQIDTNSKVDSPFNPAGIYEELNYVLAQVGRPQPLPSLASILGVTDEAVARWDGASGQFLQNSTAILSDTGHLLLNLGSPGAVTTHTTSGLTIQKNDSVGLQLLAPDNKTCEINFGFPTGGALRGRIYYGGSTYTDADIMQFGVALAGPQFKISANGAIVGPSPGSLTASTAFEVSSTTGAILIPRMTEAQRDALTAANAMIVYNTTAGKFQGREAGAWTNFI